MTDWAADITAKIIGGYRPRINPLVERRMTKALRDAVAEETERCAKAAYNRLVHEGHGSEAEIALNAIRGTDND